LTCKSECKERFKLYTEIEDCIKRYCGEEWPTKNTEKLV
jgi:hypothetical protein